MDGTAGQICKHAHLTKLFKDVDESSHTKIITGENHMKNGEQKESERREKMERST